jgi:ABC-type methionine transport system permease subunit
MIACIVLLVACVALIQLLGDLLARSVDHRR